MNAQLPTGGNVNAGLNTGLRGNLGKRQAGFNANQNTRMNGQLPTGGNVGLGANTGLGVNLGKRQAGFNANQNTGVNGQLPTGGNVNAGLNTDSAGTSASVSRASTNSSRVKSGWTCAPTGKT